MKPIPPLSLLLFLHITTAALIPFKHTKFLPEHNLHCTLYQCRFGTVLGRACKQSSLSSKLQNPHFPSHQLSPPYPLSSSDSVTGHRLFAEVFNNAPISPPTAVRPSKALTANVPLESSYLRSLSIQNPAPLDPEPESETDALPAKPTTTLPQLRTEDLEQYWASLQGKKNKLVQEMVLDVASLKCFYQSNYDMATGNPDSRAITGQPMSMAKEYSELLVIGIVVLFLCMVIIWDAVENIGDILRIKTTEIFLKVDEAVPSIFKKPCYLQPPPLRHEIAVNNYTDSDGDTKKKTLHDDSDVFNKV